MDPSSLSAPKPLAIRMRPQTLNEIVGQKHILAPESLLPRLIRNGNFGNLLFYGPPGCGKTTLAEVIARETNSQLLRINAVLSNVSELRDAIRMIRYAPEKHYLLFIDEIHRFNKAQQDLLLPDVEEGNVRLIGATTHNPSFYLIPALLSRSHLFHLEPLAEDDIVSVLRNALYDTTRGLGNLRCDAGDKILQRIAYISNGDLRRALNALESIAQSVTMGSHLKEEDVLLFAQERKIHYDANEDEHYNTISAYIKSIRGNDPDAAMYWLVKMLEGGEDPRFIARRLIILASEDVGLADARALPLAVAAMDACEYIGMPECAINLAHVTTFMATTPKSNSSYQAFLKTQAHIRSTPVQNVPLWLKDSHHSVGKQLGHGKDYLYSHDYPENISGQNYLEKPFTCYLSKNIGNETYIAERLDHWKKLKAELQHSPQSRDGNPYS